MVSYAQDKATETGPFRSSPNRYCPSPYAATSRARQPGWLDAEPTRGAGALRAAFANQFGLPVYYARSGSARSDFRLIGLNAMSGRDQPQSHSKMAFPSPPQNRPCLRLFGCAVLLMVLSTVMAPQSQGQDIGRLYATKPPPGYAFVRIAAESDGVVPPIQVNSADLPINEVTGASAYRAVAGNQPLKLSVNGSTISNDVVPRAESYLTLVISKTNSVWTVQSIDEGQGSSDGLKAKLRFFNLVPGCAATLRIAEGPTIFQQAAFVSVQSRTVNPVTAMLEGSCGQANATLAIPQLRSGDFYSLFLRKDAERLRLTGQLDETEPYRER